MKLLRWLLGPKTRFDLVAGLGDGILTALTLAGGKLLGPEAAMSFDLALRVAVAAAVSGAFIFFVAHYAVLRSELVEAERQLNLTEHGRLVTSRLGRAALIDAGSKAMVTAVFSFSGALLPLIVGVVWPVLALVVALAALTVLGSSLGKIAHGRPLIWAVSMLAGGIAVAYIGFSLKIV
jgi:predicted membrane protein (TIGR00267 family)